MKPLRNRRAIFTAAILTVTATSCGSPAASRAASQPTPACTVRHGATVTVTDADSGSDICIDRGAHLEVYLHGSPAQMWSPIQTSGAALAPAVSGKNTLMLGVTGAFYAASGVGTTEVTSGLSPCATPSAGGTSPSCRPGASFILTVVVP